MRQINLPRKTISAVQLWASLVLIIMAFAISLTPIITLQTSTNIAEIEEFMDDIVEDGELPDIPDEVEVSAIKLVSLVSLISKVVNVMKSATSDMTSGETELSKDTEDSAEDLKEYLETEQGREDLVLVAALAITIIKTVDFEDSENVAALILNVLVSIIGLISVLILTLVIPIILLINLIGALIAALKNTKTPENASANVGGKLTKILSLPFSLMLFQCVVPGMVPASGAFTLAYICVASVVLNFVCSRLRSYPQKQFVYLNILQGTAAVGIAGFLVFFFNIIKSGIFNAFTGGSFASYLAEVVTLQAADVSGINNSYIVDGVLMMIYLCVMLSCASYLEKVARRFSCAIKPEGGKGLIGRALVKPKAQDCYLGMAISTVFVYVIPKLIANFKHFYLVPTSTASEGDASFLELSSKSEDALNAALIGIILMLVAEIALLVLKKVFCKDLTAEEAETLMLGLAEAEVVPVVEAAPAPEAAPVVETAPVAEPAPEVQSEPVAEEAPAVEEAPEAEEVSAE